ncbi:uncharacterized protein BDZ99DRAFT_523119 [Mytilinidion resinicola]|uniref:Uncharacterized protein n=1 Tax=Mytilinidion resinicola TaxID=574789 RepID=A0A6A6YFA0_9PEZI|nr:uncharacterized protein BDZ99DRAFT_523119 [Mytilinidion resinicola]KAF2807506.1 hypothetical protein BDZ99DRAFT_523119 [Mytilinidion resinicola]
MAGYELHQGHLASLEHPSPYSSPQTGAGGQKRPAEPQHHLNSNVSSNSIKKPKRKSISIVRLAQPSMRLISNTYRECRPAVPAAFEKRSAAERFSASCAERKAEIVCTSIKTKEILLDIIASLRRIEIKLGIGNSPGNWASTPDIAASPTFGRPATLDEPGKGQGALSPSIESVQGNSSAAISPQPSQHEDSPLTP